MVFGFCIFIRAKVSIYLQKPKTEDQRPKTI